MTDEPDTLVLVYLRRLETKVDRVIDDLHDIKVRLTNLEERQAGLNRRMDRLEAPVERIESRLDPVDMPH